MLPQDAMVVSGNQTYCFLLQDGKAVKTAVVPGLRDGAWVEVTKMKIDDQWVKVTRRRGRDHGCPGRVDRWPDGEYGSKTSCREPAASTSYCGNAETQRTGWIGMSFRR